MDIPKLEEGMLDRAFVKDRYQGGKKFSYLSNKYVKKMTNEIFGHDGWSSEVKELNFISEVKSKNKEGKDIYIVTYYAIVRFRCGDIVREDAGTCSSTSFTPNPPHDTALKGAVTDAFKRCMVSFGDIFGLSLYDDDSGGDGNNKNNSNYSHPPRPQQTQSNSTSSSEVMNPCPQCNKPKKADYPLCFTCNKAKQQGGTANG